MTKLIDDLAADLPDPDEPADDDTTVTSRRSPTRSGANDAFLVVAHENPDGDALGSLLAMTIALRELGKDVVMYLSGDAPTPGEYGFLDLSTLQRELPADLERARAARPRLRQRAAHRPRPRESSSAPRVVLNVDHHHDNSRFGDVNLIVDDASSTAEIVRDMLSLLDVPLTPDVAEALYVALVTDTGRFQYSNTTPKALRLAADLVEAGADVHGIFRLVYETVQFAKLKLLARALERAAASTRAGASSSAYLLKDDFAEVGAEEPYSEGIIDYLRSVEGSEMVALIREPPRDDGPARRISLRSSRDEVDVSAIARAAGGGGHRQAAGFCSDLEIDGDRRVPPPRVRDRRGLTSALLL